MRFSIPAAAALFAGLALMTSAPACASATLTSAVPPADAKASDVRSLSLVFSEPVTATRSGVEIVMTAMPGMGHHQPMTVSGFQTAFSADGKTLTVTLPRALPAGSYMVSWHVVTIDGATAEGRYGISAR